MSHPSTYKGAMNVKNERLDSVLLVEYYFPLNASLTEGYLASEPSIQMLLN